MGGWKGRETRDVWVSVKRSRVGFRWSRTWVGGRGWEHEDEVEVDEAEDEMTTNKLGTYVTKHIKTLFVAKSESLSVSSSLTRSPHLTSLLSVSEFSPFLRSAVPPNTQRTQHDVDVRLGICLCLTTS